MDAKAIGPCCDVQMHSWLDASQLAVQLVCAARTTGNRRGVRNELSWRSLFFFFSRFCPGNFFFFKGRAVFCCTPRWTDGESVPAAAVSQVDAEPAAPATALGSLPRSWTFNFNTRWG
jgi:hypothetical protein